MPYVTSLLVLLLHNPRSGRGRARRAAEALSWTLRRAGHEARLAAVGPGEPALQTVLPEAGALVVLGGDGTVHGALPGALATGVPIYHLPLGTENLFAREFGMDRSAARLLRALDRPAVEGVDVGVVRVAGEDGAAAPRPFALMLSVGPDAHVTARVAQGREGGGLGGRLSFVTPILAEALRPWLPTLSVQIDGVPMVSGQRGMLVIANSRRYALRIDPAARASMTDGLLDVVFFPAASTFAALSWLVSARLRRHLDLPHLSYRTARQVRVASVTPGALPVQADGEALECPRGALEVEVRPGALRVLRP